MKSSLVAFSVNDAAERIKTFLQKKDFVIFADIDHKLNAANVDLDLPDSRVIIFGNPTGGTKLMQKDIFISFDLPLRLAVVEKEGKTFLLHDTVADYNNKYQVEGHPVLDNIEKLFTAITAELSD